MCSFLNAPGKEWGLNKQLLKGTHQEVWFTSVLLLPLHSPTISLQCSPLCLYLKDRLTRRQPKNHGNPYAWCVTAELSVSAAHAPAYLQQAIMVYQFTVGALTPVQLGNCMGHSLLRSGIRETTLSSNKARSFFPNSDFISPLPWLDGEQFNKTLHCVLPTRARENIIPINAQYYH